MMTDDDRTYHMPGTVISTFYMLTVYLPKQYNEIVTNIFLTLMHRDIKNLPQRTAAPELGFESEQFDFRIHVLNH